MPRYSVTICSDCSATLGAGGSATITTTGEGLICQHATTVSYDPPALSGPEATAALLTIVGLRPQSMVPEIRTVHLRQADLDRLAHHRPGLAPAEWLQACANIDLEAVWDDAEFGKPESD